MRVRTCFISVVTIFIVLVVIFYFGEVQRTWAQAELGEKYGGYYVLSLSEYLGFEVVNLYPTNLSPNGEELAWIEGGERLIHTDLKLNKLDEEDISPYQGSYLTWSPQGDRVACLLSKGDRYNLGVWEFGWFGGFTKVFSGDIVGTPPQYFWRWDGEKLSLVPGSGNPGEAWEIRSDGLGIDSSPLGECRHSKSSPDGRYIAYMMETAEGGGWQLRIYDRDEDTVTTPISEAFGSASYIWLGEYNSLLVVVEGDAYGGYGPPVGIYLIQKGGQEVIEMPLGFDFSRGSITALDFDNERRTILFSWVPRSGPASLGVIPVKGMGLYQVKEVEMDGGIALDFVYIPSRELLVYKVIR